MNTIQILKWRVSRLRIGKDQRGISNVIVFVLGLVIVTVIVSNVFLWNYEMNQLDWERMQEDIELSDISGIVAASNYNPSEYTLGGSTSWISGDITNLQSDDGVYMTFRSYYTGNETIDFVDQRCDLYYPSERGSHSSFTAQQQGPDAVYDTLSEENTAPVLSETRYLTSSQHTVNGFSAYECSTTQTSSYLNRSSSRQGSHNGTWGIRVWKRDSEGTMIEITSGSIVATVSRSTEGEGIQSNSWDCPQTSLLSTDAIVIRVYVSLGAGDNLLEEFVTEQLDASQLKSATWTIFYWTRLDWNPPTTYSYFGFGDSAHDSRIQDFSYSAGSNYELDLEVQWIGIDQEGTEKELCIYGGTMGSENLKVDVWYDSAWQNLLTDLSSGWNNVSVAPYAPSSTFTIRFRDNMVEDDTKDSWNIDVTLLHIWRNEYTAEVQFTGSSDIDGWLQLNWTVDSAWTVGSVTVTLQLFDYQLGEYPTSGDGYIAYTSRDTPNIDETHNQSIADDPGRFRNDTGHWRIRIRGVKNLDESFDFKGDWIEFKPASEIGTSFIFKNQGAISCRLVSLWIINSTHHRRYDVDLVITSERTLTYPRLDITSPSEPYTVKIVTERGNMATHSEG